MYSSSQKTLLQYPANSTLVPRALYSSSQRTPLQSLEHSTLCSSQSTPLWSLEDCTLVVRKHYSCTQKTLLECPDNSTLASSCIPHSKLHNFLMLASFLSRFYLALATQRENVYLYLWAADFSHSKKVRQSAATTPDIPILCCIQPIPMYMKISILFIEINLHRRQIKHYFSLQQVATINKYLIFSTFKVVCTMYGYGIKSLLLYTFQLWLFKQKIPWAVVVVKWSVCSPSTLTIPVRIPLKATVFCSICTLLHRALNAFNILNLSYFGTIHSSTQMGIVCI